ncbi:MAG: S1 RNA-binding domain-containing protein [Oscillibacter sp.]|nr:S1 RNA-binding domain-containing protein [Oscillibacter sp.]
MPENRIYLPEGLRPRTPMTLASLRSAMEAKTVLEGSVLRCGADHTLHVALGSYEGLLPRSEAVAPWISGAERDIALLSRVGKPVCFIITDIQSDEKGAPKIFLSRKAVQEQARDWLFAHLQPGTVLTGCITHLEPFGAFLDIGCGIIAMLPIESISVARIPHPSARLHVGQKILCALSSVDREHSRFTMTHKELLGTWMENASYFAPGETVPGIVRSIRDYGCFVELTPNLSGLADLKEEIREGDRVSVYIKSIRPERMKIKLQIIEALPPEAQTPALRYFVTDGQLERWTYSPPNYEKPPVETIFTSDP